MLFRTGTKESWESSISQKSESDRIRESHNENLAAFNKDEGAAGLLP